LIHPLTRMVLTSKPQFSLIKPVSLIHIKFDPCLSVGVSPKLARRPSYQSCLVDLKNDKRFAAHQLSDVNRSAMPAVAFSLSMPKFPPEIARVPSRGFCGSRVIMLITPPIASEP